MVRVSVRTVVFFFFNDTATTEIYTLSLHDALPISLLREENEAQAEAFLDAHADFTLYPAARAWRETIGGSCPADRKSTRLNSSHLVISYAVFCLKKKTDDTLTSHGTSTSALPLCPS